MAKDNIGEYSSTAASNTVVGDVNIAEGTLPSAINNAIREVMSHLADAHGAIAAYQGVTNSITAGSTQTQAGATALTEPINRVTTVGTNGDGVKLPTATAGLSILIINSDAAQTLKVWPNTSDAIDQGSANAVDADQIAPGRSRLYVAIDATDWYTALNDLGSIPLGVASGGTGAATLTDGGILLGSGTGAITATAVLTDGQVLVGDGSGDPVAESGATLRSSLGLGTGDSPQFTGVNVGAASDTTVTRASAGDLNVEGNVVYRAGGTDVPVADGGTGASTLTDGGVLLGSGTGAITAMAVLSNGEFLVGDGSGDPVGESGSTARDSMGIGTGATPQFLRLGLGEAALSNQVLTCVGSGNGQYTINIENPGDSNPFGIYFQYTGASPDNASSEFLDFRDASAARFEVQSDGDVNNADGTYGTISDRKFKQDIEDAGSQWDDVKALTAIMKTFRMKTDVEAGKDKKLLGLIAQEVEEISPKLVTEKVETDWRQATDDNGDPAFDSEGRKIMEVVNLGTTKKTFKQSIYFMKCARALGEAMERIEALEAQVKEMS